MRLLATVTLLSLLPAARASAQDNAELTLVVQQGGRETGRESFTVRSTRPRGAPGSTIVSIARYPATQTTLNLTTTLEREPDFGLAVFLMDVKSPTDSAVIRAAGHGARLIMRTATKGSEAGREVPGGPDIVLLDEAVFALYGQLADLATPAGRPLTAFFPRTGRRESFAARKETTTDGTTRVTLSGGLAGTVVTDDRGRLVRLELPASRTVVTRAPS